jgi:hypothetical protein
VTLTAGGAFEPAEAAAERHIVLGDEDLKRPGLWA